MSNKLPLGHVYEGHGDICERTVDFSRVNLCWVRCGQPRAAHEPVPEPCPMCAGTGREVVAPGHDAGSHYEPAITRACSACQPVAAPQP